MLEATTGDVGVDEDAKVEEEANLEDCSNVVQVANVEGDAHKAPTNVEELAKPSVGARV